MIMNILSPLSNIRETKPLIEAGADELYAGILMEGWERRFGIGNLNRRAMPYANFSDFDELKGALDISHSYGVPIFLLLNNIGYTPDQVSCIMEVAHKAVNIGIDAVVVSNIGLLSQIKIEIPEVELHVSTTGTTFNSQAAQFYKELGASRIVLDRQLTLQEIESITRTAKDIKFEAFVFNWKCMYIEGLCNIIPSFNNFYVNSGSKGSYLRNIFNSLRIDASRFKERIASLPPFILKRFGRYAHISEVKNIEPCCFSYDVSENSIIDAKDKNRAVKHIYSCFQNIFVTKIKQPDCGLCAIPELNTAGIHSLKIVGRVFPLQEKIRGVRLIRTILRNIENWNNADEWQVKAAIRKLFTEKFRLNGCIPNGCYYNSCYQEAEPHKR